jgi:hypothetical protein
VCLVIINLIIAYQNFQNSNFNRRIKNYINYSGAKPEKVLWNPLCLLNAFLNPSQASLPNHTGGLAFMSGNMTQMSKAEVFSSWVACYFK